MAPDRRTALVVDDELAIARVLSRLLGARGFAVTEAGSGMRALAALKKSSFDIAVVDVDLGGGPDGIAVGVAAKAGGARIVMMSGDPANHARVKQAGLGDMALKPLDFEEILRRLEI